MAIKRGEFGSDRLRMLADNGFITDRVMTAAVSRVVMGDSLPTEFSRAEKKTALLIVRELNPCEILSESEEQILRGVSDKTLKAMKDRHDVPAVIHT